MIISRKVYFNTFVKSQIDESHYVEGGDYILEVFVSGEVNDHTGLIINLTDLDRLIKRFIEPVDKKQLNLHVEEFKSQAFSLNLLAQYFFQKLNTEVSSLMISLEAVKIYDTLNSVEAMFSLEDFI